jgi:hypothetical protein
MVEEGAPAPDFELATDTRERVRLSALRGKPFVLYFYPKDDSRAHLLRSSPRRKWCLAAPRGTASRRIYAESRYRLRWESF